MLNVPPVSLAICWSAAVAAAIGGDADRVHVDARLLGGRDGLVERRRVVIATRRP